jgi:hypothetical protein
MYIRYSVKIIPVHHEKYIKKNIKKPLRGFFMGQGSGARKNQKEFSLLNPEP